MFQHRDSTMPAMSVRTVHDTGISEQTGATLTLVHRSEGWEIAGSGTRDAKEGWGVLYEARDGNRGGQWFRADDKASAVERFAKFTGKAAADVAK